MYYTQALSRFFGPHTGFVDMCVQHIPSPLENARQIVCMRHHKWSVCKVGRLTLFFVHW